MADLTTAAAFNNYTLHPKSAQGFLGDSFVLYRTMAKRSLKRGISPNDLIARNMPSIAFDGERVDYAMRIELSEHMRDRIRRALSSCMAEGLESAPPSSNQTAYPPIRTRPIAVSLKTKIPDGREGSAKVQLTIWAAAQLERLRRLCPNADLPALPVVLASRVQWDVYYVPQAAGKNEINIIGNHTIGYTISPLRIYKLVQCL